LEDTDSYLEVRAWQIAAVKNILFGDPEVGRISRMGVSDFYGHEKWR